MSPKLLSRLVRINWILVFHGLDELVLKTHLFRPVRYLAFFSPNFWIRKDRGPRAVRIRRTLEDLGPIFVKFGQALSTRRDLLPQDIADELSKLQDKVPPFPGADARKIIEQELAKPIGECFAEFDETPLASASIAQVHAARLPGGDDVIVKVLRPNVEKQIREDIRLLYELARLARKFWADAKRLRPVEIVAEFEKTILDELDLVREGANASELRRNFEHSKILYVPMVHWDLTRQKVLVMERIYGIPIGDIQRLRDEGVDFRLLAERGVEIFFTQVLRDNFFHADMHPGNIFAKPDASYIAVDFGIVGSLSLADQHYLAYNLLAFFNRDYRRVAELHIESGWVPKQTRVDELESGIRAVCEPIFEKPISQISYGHLLLRLFQAARRFNAEIQPQLVLFQKTLLNIEGLGRELYPDLDLWKTAKPFLEKWFAQQVGPRATVNKIRKQLPEWGEQLPEIPGLVHRFLKEAGNGELELTWKNPQLEEIRQQLARNNRRAVRAIGGAACIISAAILTGMSGYLSQSAGSIPPLALAVFLAGMLLIALGLRK
ncbi:MAG: ubiquinone biosynthesis regulatory protein kinase UbiB [Methylococcaceae bacterium]|nr:ubiquinone biosynthesis regulatory protein kinase UbiB [Methylococcaceae bacterium]MCI0667285.1 ubiquinone biosynthesis regulatory protein kinase UbiB [Methylococcaceae bacterium]MCI0733427.1 ubiquinone biosynthesis regulatory protein kinase UbiB [Methylococcaceae bacterium]